MSHFIHSVVNSKSGDPLTSKRFASRRYFFLIIENLVASLQIVQFMPLLLLFAFR